MNKEKNFERVDTSGLTNKEQIKEPTLPVFIPMRIVRWIFYSCFFGNLLIPFIAMAHESNIKSGLACICGGLILGHFASQLNALINKKP